MKKWLWPCQEVSTARSAPRSAARAIGDNLIPIYIDTGLMRKGETERIRTIFNTINLQIVDAGDEFLSALKGITEPEAKRKAIGERFIRVFEREARKQGATCLLQGTIYPVGSRVKGVSRVTIMSGACHCTWNLQKLLSRSAISTKTKLGK